MLAVTTLSEPSEELFFFAVLMASHVSPVMAVKREPVHSILQQEATLEKPGLGPGVSEQVEVRSLRSVSPVFLVTQSAFVQEW